MKKKVSKKKKSKTDKFLKSVPPEYIGKKEGTRLEEQFYHNLPEELLGHFHSIIDISSTDNTDIKNFKYIHSPTQSTLAGQLIYDEPNSNVWTDHLTQIRNKLAEFSKHSIPWSYDIYSAGLINEVQQAYSLLVQQQIVEHASNFPTVTINENECINFDSCWEMVRSIIANFDGLPLCVCHGKLYFSNISDLGTEMLQSNNTSQTNIQLLNPVGWFGKEHIYGDRYVDIGAILMSVLHSADFIINDKFNINQSYNIIKIDIPDHTQYKKNTLWPIYNKIFKEYDFARTQIVGALGLIITASHFSNQPDKAKALFYTGLNALNQSINFAQ